MPENHLPSSRGHFKPRTEPVQVLTPDLGGKTWNNSLLYSPGTREHSTSLRKWHRTTLCHLWSLRKHTGICRQQPKKLFCNSRCSDLIITPVRGILLSGFEKDPINFGLFFRYCTKDWHSATCVKQLYTRRKYCFTTILYSFFNWILGFFSKRVFLFAWWSTLSKCFTNSTAKLILDKSREGQC